MKIKEIVHNECKNIDFNFDKFKSHIEISKIDINSLDSKGNTPLYYFCQNKRVNIEGIKYFIENKANLNAKNKKNEIPMHNLGRNINIKLNILEYMIEKKSDLNVENVDKELPIHLASSNNNIKLEMIKHMVESKSELDVMDKKGNLPAHLYANHKKFKFDILKILIEENMISKEQGNARIMDNLCKNENVTLEALKYMLEEKVDVGKRNTSENTALQLLCRNRAVTLEMVKYLIECKSDVHNENKFGDNLIHYCCQNESIDDEIIDYLLEQHKCKLIANKRSETPLLLACLNQKIGENVMRKLAIKEHLDLNDKFGNSPLLFRASMGNMSLDMIKMLGVDKSVFTQHDKLGELLCDNESLDLEMLKFFVENKTDLNYKNGYTIIDNILYNNGRYIKTPMKPLLDPHIIKHFYGELKVDEILIKNYSLLHLVCFTKNISLEVLKFMHEKTPSEWAKSDSSRKTPLEYIASNEKVTLEMVKYVCEIRETFSFESFDFFLYNLSINLFISKDIVDFILENFKEHTNTLLSTFLQKEPLENEMITYLLDKKASFTEKTSGKSPFSHLCKNESANLELIKLFVENKAIINEEESLNTLLQHKNLKTDLVQYLIENKASLDLQPSSFLYLNSHLNLETLRVIFENKYIEKEGKSTLIKNVCLGDIFRFELKEYLVKNSSVEDLTNTLVSCFKKQARREKPRKLDVNLIRCLVDNKADIDHITQKGKSLLHLACEYNDKNCLPVVKHFIESKINAQSSNKDETPLHLALSSQRNVSINELVLYLVENGNSVNESEFCDECLPLHLASKNSYVSLRTLKYLADRTDNINQQNRIGYTALFFELKASPESNFEVTKFLVELKMDLSLKNIFNQDVLFWKCASRKIQNIDLDTIKYYVDNKCDVLCVSSKGDNLLHSFLKKNVFEKEIVTYLIESKVDLNLKNETKLSPIASFCSRKKTPELSFLTFLLDSKASLNDESKFVEKIKVDNKHLLYLLLSQTDILFKNSKSGGNKDLKDIFEKYLVGTHWDYSSHSFFPELFKCKVFIFLLCLRLVKKNLQHIFPKPLVVRIFQFATSPDYSMDVAFEIDLQSTYK
eukprot:TRINITY_DN4950_c0_g1_i1.p1 TRINITY_DN4950_c0_g1~~TRINITY_DN4950_c0_g1_i1.p1  ORF type:complete len:1085 (-),score=254.85 TRINITY_DN4950_c0_g1_i1:33-3287(-)